MRKKKTPSAADITTLASRTRARLVAAQQAAASQVLTGASEDDLVQIEVNGDMGIRRVSIDSSLAGDTARTEELVTAALKDAVAKVTALRAGSTGGADLSNINLGAASLGG